MINNFFTDEDLDDFVELLNNSNIELGNSDLLQSILTENKMAELESIFSMQSIPDEYKKEFTRNLVKMKKNEDLINHLICVLLYCESDLSDFINRAKRMYREQEIKME